MRLVHKGLRAQQEHKGRLVLLALPGLMVQPVHRGLRVQRVRPALPVPLARKARRGSTRVAHGRWAMAMPKMIW